MEGGHTLTSSILRTILTSWVASCSCCCLPTSVSNTFCLRMSMSPVHMQSTPRKGLLWAICAAFAADTVEMGERPEFSARAMGISSRASAKARMAYCSIPAICC